MSLMFVCLSLELVPHGVRLDVNRSTTLMKLGLFIHSVCVCVCVCVCLSVLLLTTNQNRLLVSEPHQLSIQPVSYWSVDHTHTHIYVAEVGKGGVGG